MASLLSTPPTSETLVERILREGPIGMPGIARLMGTSRGGRPVHPSFATRMAMQGYRRPDGSVVKLESIRLGSRLVSSKPALIRFLEAQQDDAGDSPVRSPSARERAVEKATGELEKLGC